MKKYLLLVLLSLSIVFAGCNIGDKSDKYVSYENTIMSKDECIESVKTLLGINNVYFFDCDFSGMSGVKIVDISYNLSVSGTLTYDTDRGEYVVDTDKQAEIIIVTNYQIESDNTAAFGFSFESSVLRPMTTTNTIVDGEVVSSEVKPMIIYSKNTYSSVSELYYSYATYGNNSSQGTSVINVPEGFYPCNLIPDATSVVSTFSKINGDITSSSTISVFDSPVHIVAHYQSYSDKNADDNPFIETLNNYFVSNGKYISG